MKRWMLAVGLMSVAYALMLLAMTST